ncbi:MAG: precorrin-6A reductase [Tissierellia bacterium]|nr:precorrin-6A reductase [Tissierellia bacterium]
MIWIIGGTSDSRRFLESLEYSGDIITSVTTEYAKSLLDKTKVFVGRMGIDEMKDFCIDNSIDIILDMSHPFAFIVSENAERVSRELNIKYFRFTRTKIKSDEGILVDDIDELGSVLEEISGNILFTTGSKDIPKLEEFKKSNRHIYRILPLMNSLEIANKAGVEIEDLVCMKGPFTVEMNNAIIRNFDADYMIMKESGENSGFSEKIESCMEMGITPIIIKRPVEEGINSFEELREIVQEYRKKK